MVRIKWHLQAKQVKKKVDLNENNDRDKESHIESKQIS